jgi:hypothetical protein
MINRNPALYGPGPLARRMPGIGAKPPLQGLVTVAMQGIVLGIAGAFAYKWTIGDPMIKDIEKYYQENPSR